ncbi:hypothetical protein M9980_10770 [Sphingomonas donggukensis]|uniref:Uncharacterized protein n=1 Tax=Sphingomonas donggukensis TaxID=2949093 RepID=A0ABY4TSX3_9SPHN|nr:hypothetical protein [Sphingomonas donggukensis]URW75039.1 hypothetical protein M9980_10770 [Sphingomonas donggukensis]
MAKKPSKALSIAPAPPPTTIRQMGNELVRVDAVYHVQDVAPNSPGPWNIEAEKVAWIDAATGYGCIIRRSAGGGHLEGYVGVKPGHPLFGYSASALRDLGLRVHGGINYAEPCLGPEPEDRSVCHISLDERMRTSQTPVHAQARDDMWWIGFECNQPTDLVPKQRASSASSQLLGTVEQVYRDEGYVLDQCRWLAEQMKAIGDGHMILSGIES